MLTHLRTVGLAMFTIVAALSGRPTIGPLQAQSVTVVDSDVYFREAPGATARRLTTTGPYKEATLSPGHPRRLQESAVLA